MFEFICIWVQSVFVVVAVFIGYFCVVCTRVSSWSKKKNDTHTNGLGDIISRKKSREREREWAKIEHKKWKQARVVSTLKRVATF